MSVLSLRTKTQMTIALAVIATICAIVATVARLTSASLEDWLALGVLVLFAGIMQAVERQRCGSQSNQMTTALLYTGVLLLQPALVVVLVLVSAVTHVTRQDLPWKATVHRLVGLLIAAVGARYVYQTVPQISVGGHVDAGVTVAAIPAAVFFLVVRQSSAIVSARMKHTRVGEQPRRGALVGLVTVADLGVLCLGGIVAVLWQISPWLSVLAFPPLLLAHHALSVPHLKAEARQDAKTGLLNARYFMEALHAEFQRASRSGRPMAVIMADLDLLREVNNRYGHLAGDVVLTGVASIIKNSLREYDVAGRFGGEEFSVLLPDTTEEQALAVAERIRRKVEAKLFRVPTSAEALRITISLGLAVYPTHGLSSDELLHMADMAVYASKRNGRNKSCVVSPDEVARAGLQLPSGAVAADSAIGPPPETAAVSETAAVLSDRVPHVRNDATGNDATTGSGRSWSTRRRSTDVPWTVVAVMGGVGVAYAATALLVCPGLSMSDFWGLALFLVLAIVAEHYGVAMYAHSRVSISFVFVMSVAILYGPGGSLVVASLLALTPGFMRRHAPHKVVFNVGALGLAAVGASSAFHAFGVSVEPTNVLPLILAALAATVVNYLVNTSLVALIVACTTQQTVVGVWREKFQWLFLHYLVLGLLGLLAALAYRSLGIVGLLAFLAPPIMMRYAMKQYVERTVDNVHALRKANDDLRGMNKNVEASFRQLHDTYEETLRALSMAIDSRDAEMEGHSWRALSYSRAIAHTMDLPDALVAGIAQGALLHDVGKIGISDAILRKPGPLSAEEWAEVRRHPHLGARILGHVQFLDDAVPVVRCHHEKYDGSGYPAGLEAEQIPLSARVFAVADAFDAMTSDRPYRTARSHEAAREEIRRCSGSHFDPAVVDAFLSIPQGDLRRLAHEANAARLGEHPINGAVERRATA